MDVISINKVDENSIFNILQWYLYEHNLLIPITKDDGVCYDAKVEYSLPGTCYEVDLNEIDNFFQQYDFINYDLKKIYRKVTDTKAYIFLDISAGIDERSHIISSWYSDEMMSKTTTSDYITIRDEFTTKKTSSYIKEDRTIDVVYYQFKKENKTYKLIKVYSL